MQTVNIDVAKTHLSRLVDAAAGGEEIVIARAGKPVARLVALAPERRPRELGRFRGQIGHVPDGFDDPLPDDVLAQFEGR